MGQVGLAGLAGLVVLGLVVAAAVLLVAGLSHRCRRWFHFRPRCLGLGARLGARLCARSGENVAC